MRLPARFANEHSSLLGVLGMRVCVTGGSGFIGRYFCEAFHARGHQVTVLDLVPPRFDVQPDRLVHGDVCDPAKVSEAIDGCDAVLHLAAAHHDYGVPREHFFKVNEGGARVICQAMTSAGKTNVCFYSSVAVYGAAPEPRSETTPPQPLSDYGQSKLGGEKVFEAWAREQAGRSCLVIRPTVTFGPRNFANMYSLLRQIHKRRFLPVGDGRNVKSLSYVENIVDATLYLWNVEGGAGAGRFAGPFGVFNYIDKPDLTSRQITELCYAALGRRAPPLSVPLPLAIMMGWPFDLITRVTGKNLPVSSARVRKLCTQTKFEAERVRDAGYRAKLTLQQGIERMARWYVDQGQYQKPYGPVSSE
jgi:nucleoside-diphosphate-sugar epimerase